MYTYHDGLSAACKVPTYVSSKPDAYGRRLYISRCKERKGSGVWYCSDSLNDIGRPAGGLRSAGPVCVGSWQYIAEGKWALGSAACAGGSGWTVGSARNLEKAADERRRSVEYAQPDDDLPPGPPPGPPPPPPPRRCRRSR